MDPDARLALLLLLFPWVGAEQQGCPDHEFLGCVLRLRIQQVPFDKNVLNVVFSITSEAKLQHTCRAYSDALPCFRGKIQRCGSEKQRRMLVEVQKMLSFFCSPFSVQNQERFLQHSSCIGDILQLPATTECPSHQHPLGKHLANCKETCKAKGEFLCMMKIWISEQSLCTLMDMEAKCGPGSGQFYRDLQQNVFDLNFPIICDYSVLPPEIHSNSVLSGPFPARFGPQPTQNLVQSTKQTINYFTTTERTVPTTRFLPPRVITTPPPLTQRPWAAILSSIIDQFLPNTTTTPTITTTGQNPITKTDFPNFQPYTLPTTTRKRTDFSNFQPYTLPTTTTRRIPKTDFSSFQPPYTWPPATSKKDFQPYFASVPSLNFRPTSTPRTFQYNTWSTRKLPWYLAGPTTDIWTKMDQKEPTTSPWGTSRPIFVPPEPTVVAKITPDVLFPLVYAYTERTMMYGKKFPERGEAQEFQFYPYENSAPSLPSLRFFLLLVIQFL